VSITVYIERGQQLVLASEIGRGGEGTIYASPLNKQECAKIYSKLLSREDERKLELMVQNPPRDPTYDTRKHHSIAWPSALLFKDAGCSQRIGFLMPAVDAKIFRKAMSYMDPSDRTRLFGGGFNWKYLYTAAFNIVSCVAAIHEKGYCIGDINESNVLVAPNALITLIDCDSFQVSDHSSGKNYRCMVGKAEYAAPELQRKSYSEVDRTPESDCFALAVLIFQLLMEGTHPYQAKGRLVEDATSTQAKIVKGYFPYTMQDRNISAPDHAPPFNILHPEIQRLFHRCFVEGHQDPSARPMATEWFETLKKLGGWFTQCTVNQNHVFLDHLNSCPWCKLANLTGKDPFPSPVGQQIGLDDPSSAVESLDNRLAYFNTYLVMALADGVLTTEEESQLHTLGSKLQIPPKDIEKAIQAEAKKVKARTSSSGGGMPKPEISKSVFEFKNLRASSTAQDSFVVTNTGGGILRGSIRSNRPWLKPLQIQIDTTRHRQEISFLVDTAGLRLGDKEQGVIEIRSNGGTEFIHVNISVEIEKMALSRFAWSLAAGGFLAGSLLSGGLFGILRWAGMETGSEVIAMALVVILGAKSWNEYCEKNGRNGSTRVGCWIGGGIVTCFGTEVVQLLVRGLLGAGAMVSAVNYGLAYSVLLVLVARRLFNLRQKGIRSFIVVAGLIGIILGVVLVIFTYLAGHESAQQAINTPRPSPVPNGSQRAIFESLNSTVTALRFFESGPTAAPKEQRNYTTRFDKSSTRYVNWELGLSQPSPASRVDFPIEAVWYGPDGRMVNQFTTSAYVLPGWTTSWSWASWGCAQAPCQVWHRGTYKVVLSIQSIQIAAGSFEIVGDDQTQAAPSGLYGGRGGVARNSDPLTLDTEEGENRRDVYFNH
jgi:serine/threonine protein kinase